VIGIGRPSQSWPAASCRIPGVDAVRTGLGLNHHLEGLVKARGAPTTSRSRIFRSEARSPGVEYQTQAQVGAAAVSGTGHHTDSSLVWPGLATFQVPGAAGLAAGLVSPVATSSSTG
jgi:hypothetical protein